MQTFPNVVKVVIRKEIDDEREYGNAHEKRDVRIRIR